MNTVPTSLYRLRFQEFRRRLAERDDQAAVARPIHQVSSGIPWIDRLAGGGIPSRGVFGIVAPTGVGASVLATMIAAQGIRTEEQNPTSTDHPRGWLLFDRHNGRSLTTDRLVSYLAGLPRGCIERRPYAIANERTKAADDNGITRAFELLKTRLRCLDSDEIYDCFLEVDLRARVASRKCTLAGIVIDNLQNIFLQCQDAWERLAKCLDVPAYGTFFYQAYLEIVCRLLSERYQCPVWVTHHANGKASRAAPIAPLLPGNAKECKSFVDYLDACFVLGNKSDDQELFAVRCVKSPYLRTHRDTQVVVRHNDTVSTVDVVDDVYADPITKQWKLTQRRVQIVPDDCIDEISEVYAQLIADSVTAIKNTDRHAELEAGSEAPTVLYLDPFNATSLAHKVRA